MLAVLNESTEEAEDIEDRLRLDESLGLFPRLPREAESDGEIERPAERFRGPVPPERARCMETPKIPKDHTEIGYPKEQRRAHTSRSRPRAFDERLPASSYSSVLSQNGYGSCEPGFQDSQQNITVLCNLERTILVETSGATEPRPLERNALTLGKNMQSLVKTLQLFPRLTFLAQT